MALVQHSTMAAASAIQDDWRAILKHHGQYVLYEDAAERVHMVMVDLATGLPDPDVEIPRAAERRAAQAAAKPPAPIAPPLLTWPRLVRP